MTSNQESAAPKGGRPRSMRSQQAILDATLSLMAAEGFDAMTIDAIAATAGVGKKTIYRWWNSKEDLVIDAIKTTQQAKNPVIDTGSLRDDLVSLFRNALQVWGSPDSRNLPRNLITLMTTHPEVFQAYYDQVLASRIQQAIQIVRRAQAAGEIRQDLDATEIATILSGPIWYHLLFAESGQPAQARPELLIDAILGGISGRTNRDESETRQT